MRTDFCGLKELGSNQKPLQVTEGGNSVIPKIAMSAFIAVLMTCGLAHAEKFTGSVIDVASIEDGQGNARILFHWDAAIDAEHFAIGRAFMKFDMTGEAEARSIRLRLHPVTSPWSAADVAWSSGWSEPGGDFDGAAMSTADIDLSKGDSTVFVDVTEIVKELEEAENSNGFLVTVDPADGVGLKEADLPRFDGLANASLEISWRKVPAKPIELQQDDSADTD
jgi:hypothetical protein